MAKDDNKIFNNKNGYYTDEELLEFQRMSDEDFYNMLRKFNTTDFKCPPLKYKMVNCFFCVDCMKQARRLVREKKVK